MGFFFLEEEEEGERGGERGGERSGLPEVNQETQSAGFWSPGGKRNL